MCVRCPAGTVLAASFSKFVRQWRKNAASAEHCMRIPDFEVSSNSLFQNVLALFSTDYSVILKYFIALFECIVPVYVSVRYMFQSPNYNYRLHMVEHSY